MCPHRPFHNQPSEFERRFQGSLFKSQDLGVKFSLLEPRLTNFFLSFIHNSTPTFEREPLQPKSLESDLLF